MKRREFLAATGGAALASTLAKAGGALAQNANFTEWGWPKPYTQVSANSVKWLRDQGWWPLKLGSQPGFTGMPVAVPKGFYKDRGLEVEVLPFFSGPAINEAVVANRVQGGLEGNFPFTSLIARDFPVRCIGVLNPNLKHAVLVPLDSPIKSFAELKTQSEKPAFGIVTGSSAEFFFNEALRVHGMEPGKDVILKNMAPADMLIMPKGLTGVVQWNPWVWDQMLMRKNARQLESIFAYNFYMGNLFLRKEIIDNAPDVAQAVMDGFVEGILYTRYKPEEAIEITLKDEMHKRFPPEIIKNIVEFHNNLYKPTWFYPNREFWAQENGRVAAWLHQTGRLQRLVTPEMYGAIFDLRFADKTIETLGWKAPAQPPFIPANWTGKVGQVPYPAYASEDTLTAPQAFPEKGDITKRWYFAGKIHEA